MAKTCTLTSVYTHTQPLTFASHHSCPLATKQRNMMQYFPSQIIVISDNIRRLAVNNQTGHGEQSSDELYLADVEQTRQLIQNGYLLPLK